MLQMIFEEAVQVPACSAFMAMKQIIYANIFSSVYIFLAAAASQSQTHQGKEKTLQLFITAFSPAILYEWYPVSICKCSVALWIILL